MQKPRERPTKGCAYLRQVQLIYYCGFRSGNRHKTCKRAIRCAIPRCQTNPFPPEPLLLVAVSQRPRPITIVRNVGNLGLTNPLGLCTVVMTLITLFDKIH